MYTYTTLDRISLLHPRLYDIALLLLDCKPVQHVTVLNTVGNCNSGIITLNYIMWAR